MEEYRDIKGFEGLYQVSNLGNVKSLERKVWDSRGYYRTVTEKILKARKKGRGYLYVTLSKDGIDDDYYVHQLVACAFIPNPQGLPEVNHLSEDKENNCVENLEWVSHEYNCSYGTRIKRIAEANTNHPKMSKPVISISKVSGLITEYKSAHEAERITGINNGNIVKCCKGKIKSCGGYYWMYKD